MSSRNLLLVRSKILGLFIDTLTFDDTYSRQNRENLPQRIQMQLSQKPKTFSEFFISFLKSPSNFGYFEQKDESHSLSISEINESQKGGYLNV